MISLDFQQVDVFSSVPLRGNPLAVVEKADALSEGKMAAFANWTNLSETTFLLKPTHPDADYRLRIFTLYSELPFAGHPALGSCHVWLSSLDFPQGKDIMQECGTGTQKRSLAEGCWSASRGHARRHPFRGWNLPVPIARVRRRLTDSPAKRDPSHSFKGALGPVIGLADFQ
ncbi:PhzF family phenazine biosynthesis protein [Komagataeibacter xylinus]|uniref:PhzF family phenazine biosynthesis protein n=1 Tax=Komagataeibacter xylinus TaxID=28448 RepID=A0A857FSU2_KOMXY|nr:PhzF family phenazine biosynthesis protein [Komagataeibacter xylinus]